ncbi:unnamed protein product [Effrenium voratum]|nr:unnamed protein product [Effrenium voratum]
MKEGKNGTFYPPFPVLGMASDGSVFVSCGGGGEKAAKEVPNVVQAHRYDEQTGQMSTIASLDTGKSVVVALTFAGGALWLGSSGAGCKVLTLSAARRKPHAAFGPGERPRAGNELSCLAIPKLQRDLEMEQGSRDLSNGGVEKNTIMQLCEWTSEVEGKGPSQNISRLSPSGEIVACGGTDGVVRMYEAGKLDCEPPLKHKCAKNDEVLDLDFSPGQQQFIAAMSAPRGPACLALYNGDGSVVKQAKLDEKPLTAIALDTSAQMVAVNFVTGGKRVYSVPALRCLKKIENVHDLPAPCAAFVGCTAVSGSGDRSIHLLSCKKGSSAGGFTCGSCLYLLLLVLVMAIVAFLLMRIGMKGAILSEGEL